LVPSFVSNSTTPIACASGAELLQALRAVCGQIVIPNEVYRELCVIGPPRPSRPRLQEACRTWISVRQVSDPDLTSRLADYYALHRGEAETLALALLDPPDFVIVDEGDAWDAAQEVITRSQIVALPWLLDHAHQHGHLTTPVGAELRRLESLTPPAYFASRQVMDAYLRYRNGGGRGLPLPI
jgi:predicted nucleic acid-binding protein